MSHIKCLSSLVPEINSNDSSNCKQFFNKNLRVPPALSCPSLPACPFGKAITIYGMCSSSGQPQRFIRVRLTKSCLERQQQVQPLHVTSCSQVCKPFLHTRHGAALKWINISMPESLPPAPARPSRALEEAGCGALK